MLFVAKRYADEVLATQGTAQWNTTDGIIKIRNYYPELTVNKQYA